MEIFIQPEICEYGFVIFIHVWDIQLLEAVNMSENDENIAWMSLNFRGVLSFMLQCSAVERVCVF